MRLTAKMKKPAPPDLIAVRRAAARDAATLARSCVLAAEEEGARFSAMDADHIRQHGVGSKALFEAWIAAEGYAADVPCAGHAIATRGYDVRRACATLALAQLYVSPPFRRRGVARRLMSAVCQRGVELGARRLIITTGVEDQTAQRFFAAIGARSDSVTVFVMEADGIEWVAAEAQ